MASLTIRKLDDAIKAYLRLRAAGNGRSVEDEVRVILREADRRAAHFPAAACPALTFATDRAARAIRRASCDRLSRASP